MAKTNVLLFVPELAAVIGLNEAIVLHQIHYWITKNKEQGVNFNIGRWWTFSSYNKWQEQFPFWSERTVRRTLASLEKQSLLLSNRFNKRGFDQTKWYTIPYEDIPDEIRTLLTDELSTKDSGAGQYGQGQAVKLARPIQENNKENNKEREYNAHARKDICDDVIRTGYGEYKHVMLSDEERDSLIDRYGSMTVARAILHIDRQVEKTGNRYGWKKWKPVIQQAIENNWGGVMDD